MHYAVDAGFGVDTWLLSCRCVIANWSPTRQDAMSSSLDSGQLPLSLSLHRYWRNPTGSTTATTSTRRCAAYTGSIRFNAFAIIIFSIIIIVYIVNDDYHDTKDEDAERESGWERKIMMRNRK